MELVLLARGLISEVGLAPTDPEDLARDAIDTEYGADTDIISAQLTWYL